MTHRHVALPASAETYQLGEGPVWDAARERLLWVDIVAGTVLAGRLDPAAGTVEVTGRHTFDETVGAVAVAAAGDLVVAERAVVTRLDVTGERTELARVLPAGVGSRLNDGAVDPAGRFLVGSLAQDARRGGEVLVRLDDDRCVVLDRDLYLSNGLAWSPGGDRFYSIDTDPGTVWVRDYDPATGAVGRRQESFTVADGSPDGMCVDASGNLWIAVWGRGRVECRTPAGRVLATVEVAAPHTSSVAFAGPDLDLLVITTARQDLTREDLAEHPDSGRLFTARVGARGLALPYWVPPAVPAASS
ncbi:SMP-30/gluconolactonase/LRE family protein [Pseudofrankia sp. BMG5.36]|uniref:SMP-30/gluconolactonase/LRE family protein n=1 Tax=Pseudofrankia sp. BMG5.36 TaxID=1834512 RepID=UPI0008D903EF|nr:SMP-30/gluconolactonase/LRE family protein [Pseudofrankia sp. BMG5.36]OHV43480.1 gluconolactonase [Pseudofrankia sp. BMG5.36]